MIERVKTGERYELEFVTHCAELALELRDGRAIEFLLPVKRRRTVIREQLVRERVADFLGETSRFLQVRRTRLAPNQIRVRCIAPAARDRLVEPGSNTKKSFGGAFAGNEGMVALINITR